MNAVSVLTLVDRDGDVSVTVHATRGLAEEALVDGTGQRNVDDVVEWIAVFGGKVSIDTCVVNEG